MKEYRVRLYRQEVAYEAAYVTVKAESREAVEGVIKQMDVDGDLEELDWTWRDGETLSVEVGEIEEEVTE